MKQQPKLQLKGGKMFHEAGNELKMEEKPLHMLHYCCTYVIWGDLRVILALFCGLLEQMSCVSVPSLHVAAARGQTDCLTVLLAHGVDLSITDAAGRVGVHVLPIWQILKSCLLHVVTVHQERRVRPLCLLMLLQVLILYISLPKTTTWSAAGSSFRYGRPVQRDWVKASEGGGANCLERHFCG